MPRYLSVEMKRVPRRVKQTVLTKKEIGQRLRALRAERGMSQVELAAALGTYQTSLSQIERGVRGVGIQQVLKMCRALKVSPDRLIGPASKQETSAPDRNARLLRRVRRVEQLPAEHQEAVVKMLDAFLDTHARGNGRR